MSQTARCILLVYATKLIPNLQFIIDSREMSTCNNAESTEVEGNGCEEGMILGRKVYLCNICYYGNFFLGCFCCLTLYIQPKSSFFNVQFNQVQLLT